MKLNSDMKVDLNAEKEKIIFSTKESWSRIILISLRELTPQAYSLSDAIDKLYHQMLLTTAHKITFLSEVFADVLSINIFQ